MDILTLREDLSNENFDIYESKNIIDIGNRVQAPQIFAVTKNTIKEDINETNSWDVTPDYVSTVISDFNNALYTNLFLLNRKINKINLEM